MTKLLPAASGLALAQAYLLSLDSPVSRDTMAQAFRRVARVLSTSERTITADELDWGPEWTPTRCRLVRRRLVDAGLSPATVNLTLDAMRGVLKVAREQRLISKDDWDDIVSSLKHVGGSRQPKGRALTKEEARAAIDTARRYEGVRGAMMPALVSVALGGGLRRAELCRLELKGVSDDCATVTVIGKGNHENEHPLTTRTATELRRWLEVRRSLPWLHERVFATPKRGRVLSPNLLSRMVRQLSRDMGCKPKDLFAPHDLRRTFATHLLKTLPLTTVQKLMHHASVATTQRYDKREAAEMATARRAVEDPWL